MTRSGPLSVTRPCSRKHRSARVTVSRDEPIISAISSCVKRFFSRTCPLAAPLLLQARNSLASLSKTESERTYLPVSGLLIAAQLPDGLESRLGVAADKPDQVGSLDVVDLARL